MEIVTVVSIALSVVAIAKTGSKLFDFVELIPNSRDSVQMVSDGSFSFELSTVSNFELPAFKALKGRNIVGGGIAPVNKSEEKKCTTL